MLTLEKMQVPIGTIIQRGLYYMQVKQDSPAAVCRVNVRAS